MTKEDLKNMLKRNLNVKISEDSASGKIADLEPAARSKPVEEKSHPRFDSPVNLHVHSIRRKLTDADGISAKATIDGLVHSGILSDDSPKEVKKVSYSQEKGKEDQTIITITEV